MADTVTTAYSLTKPEIGASEDTWGEKINTDLDTLDTVVNAIGGKTAAGTLSYANSAKLATTATGVDVTGTVTMDGGSTSADFTFGDNDKAIFGAGSDLQIYHDGADNYVDAAGVGHLYLQSQGDDKDVKIRSDDGFGGLTDYITVDGSLGQVKLRYYGDNRLATTSTGIDVTGTVTADGLTVEDADGATIRIQSSDTSVDGGSLGQLEFYSNDASTGGTGVKGKIQVTDHGSTGTDYQMNFFTGYVSGGVNTQTKKMSIGPYGDISFYDTSGTSQAFFWDASAEILGIGTSSPSEVLQLNGATNTQIRMQPSATGNSGFINTTAGSTKGMVQYNHASDYMRIYTNGSERLRIDSSGNVGIGNTSPSYTLEVGDALGIYDDNTSAVVAANAGHDLELRSRSSQNVRIVSGGTEAMRIDSGGNVGIGTSSPGTKLHVYTDGGGSQDLLFLQNNAAGDNHYLKINVNNTANEVGYISSGTSGGAHVFYRTASTEAMRIDSSGNLLVGTTVSALHSSPTESGARLYDGGIVTAGAGTVAYFNRNGAGGDGTIIDLRKDGTTVGSIGAKDGDMYLGTGDTGLRFHDGNNQVYPTSTTTGTSLDATVSLGHSGGRFKDLYLSGGVYLGGTGAANKLDDVEFGNWTPTVSSGGGGFSGTVSVNHARYRKIGRTVWVDAYISVNVSAVGSGDARIGGLPFTVAGGYTPFKAVHGDLVLSNGGYFNVGNTSMTFIYDYSISGRPIAGTGVRKMMISGHYDVS